MGRNITPKNLPGVIPLVHILQTAVVESAPFSQHDFAATSFRGASKYVHILHPESTLVCFKQK